MPRGRKGATWLCLSAPPATHVTSVLLVTRGLLLTGHRAHILGGEKQEKGAVPSQERLNIPLTALWTSVCISRVTIGTKAGNKAGGLTARSKTSAQEGRGRKERLLDG